MPYRAYKNEDGEYTALEYEVDGPPDPDKFYEDYENWETQEEEE